MKKKQQKKSERLILPTSPSPRCPALCLACHQKRDIFHSNWQQRALTQPPLFLHATTIPN